MFDNMEYAVGFTNIRGKPVIRTQFDYPYSYEPFVTFKRDWTENDPAVYSDRLMQWDFDKFNSCCQKVWGNQGQYFNSRSPADIEKFLSRYLGEDIILTGIEQGCNLASGYPYWVFYYRKRESA